MRIKRMRIISLCLALLLFLAALPLNVSAEEGYGYAVDISPSPVKIGSEVTLTFRLTDYTEEKSGIRTFQIDITDVDDVLHNAVCTILVTDTENLLLNSAKYQSSRDIVRYAYTKSSGTMDYSVADLLTVTFTIPDTYTEAGTLSLPLKFIIYNEAKETFTYTENIDIPYVLEDSEEPDETVTSVDITWGAMDFTYSDGTWNAGTHTYENSGWDDNDSGFVTVSNTGSAAAAVELTYSTTRSDIAGEFDVDQINLSAGQSVTAHLTLTGKPAEEMSQLVIGNVTVKIGGE